MLTAQVGTPRPNEGNTHAHTDADSGERPMTVTWWVISGLALVAVSVGFIALWVLDARRADGVAADPDRVNTHRRRRVRRRRRNAGGSRGSVS